MLVVSCRNPNSAERELIESLKELDGLAFIGYIVTNGSREREIDALVITPVRAVAIEAKAPMLATPSEGDLVPHLNSPWTIGGEQASFYGNKLPNDQARVNAQMVATMLREKEVPKTPFVQSAVSVSGKDLTMEKPKMLGQTAVGLARDIVPALALMKQKPVTLDMAIRFVEALELGPLAPSKKAITKEWEQAEALHKAIPRPAAKKGAEAVVEAVTKPMPPAAEKTKVQKFVTAVADNVTLFVAIFLFVHFLNTYGIFDPLFNLLEWAFGWSPASGTSLE